jgi:hypothetical protein
MKKFLFLLSLTALAACEGPAGPTGPQGEPGMEMDVEYFTVRARDWKEIGSSQDVVFYQYVANINIGDYIYDKGNVSVFMYLMDGDNEVQVPLPYSIPRQERGIWWTEQYSFDFDRGTISFYVDYLNGLTPPDQEFRAVLSW